MASIIIGIIGLVIMAGSAVYNGVSSADEAKKNQAEAKSIADQNRQDVLGQNAQTNALAQQQLNLGDQKLSANQNTLSNQAIDQNKQMAFDKNNYNDSLLSGGSIAQSNTNAGEQDWLMGRKLQNSRGF